MIATPTAPLLTFAPKAPQTMAELGISESLVMDLVLRRSLLEGFSNLQLLSKRLRLSVSILGAVFQHMRQQQLVEVKGMIGNDYNFTLSAAGKHWRQNAFKSRSTPGAAPVSLKDYQHATKHRPPRSMSTASSCAPLFPTS